MTFDDPADEACISLQPTCCKLRWMIKSAGPAQEQFGGVKCIICIRLIVMALCAGAFNVLPLMSLLQKHPARLKGHLHFCPVAETSQSCKITQNACYCLQDATGTPDNSLPFIIGLKNVTFLDATAVAEVLEWLQHCDDRQVTLVDHLHLQHLTKLLPQKTDCHQQDLQMDAAESTHLLPMSASPPS